MPSAYQRADRLPGLLRYNQLMDGGQIGTFRAEWRAWRAAFAGLRDNPLALNFQLMRQRRLARLPWYRRNILLLLGGGIGLLWGMYFLLMSSMYTGGGYGYGTVTPSYQRLAAGIGYLEGLLSLAILMVFFWFLQRLFGALYAALTFLGLPGRRNPSEQIDDMAGITDLSDREIGAAGVNLAFAPVFKPLLALALAGLVQRHVTSISYEVLYGGQSGLYYGREHDGQSHIYSTDFERWLYDLATAVMEMPRWQFSLAILPFDLFFAVCASLLGLLLVVVLFVILGRNLRHSSAVPAAIVIYIIWILLAGYGMEMTSGIGGYSAGFGGPDFSDQLNLMFWCGLFLPFIIWLIARASLKRAATFPVVFSFLGLLYLPLLLYIASSWFGMFLGSSVFYGSGAYTGNTVFSYDFNGFGELMLAYLASGATVFAPDEPASPFTSMYWGLGNYSASNFPWHELLRPPLHILFQLFTLTALFPVLRCAVAAKRQGEG